jgi:hypothetical protein
MRISGPSIVCALVISSLCTLPDAAGSPRAKSVVPPPSIGLAIKVESTGKDIERVMPAIVREADRLWERYGVRLTGTNESAARRVQVVIVDDAEPGTFADGAGQEGLGWITFLGPESPRNVIYLSWKRALTLLSEMMHGHQPIEQLPDKQRDWYLGRALGRTLAHEIGHYLLASAEHARTGMMRARYSAAQLFDPSTNGFLLDGERERTITVAVAKLRSSGPEASVSSADPRGPDGRRAKGDIQR